MTAATSVFVAPPGSESAVAASICGATGGLSANPTWLTYLAIAFGVLFAIMLFINIFLCRQVLPFLSDFSNTFDLVYYLRASGVSCLQFYFQCDDMQLHPDGGD